MKCDKCKSFVMNDVIYRYTKHTHGPTLCDDCFWENNDRAETKKGVLAMFEDWDIEYVGDEGTENYIYYVKMIEMLSNEYNRITLLQKLEDEDDENWSDNFFEFTVDFDEE